MYDLILWGDHLWMKSQKGKKTKSPRFNTKMGYHTYEVCRSTEKQEINKVSRDKRHSNTKLFGY